MLRKVIMKVGRTLTLSSNNRSVQDHRNLIRRGGLGQVTKATMRDVTRVLLVVGVLISCAHQRKYTRRFVLVCSKTNTGFSAKAVTRTIMAICFASFASRSTQLVAIIRTMISGSVVIIATVGYLT